MNSIEILQNEFPYILFSFKMVGILAFSYLVVLLTMGERVDDSIDVDTNK